MSWWADLRTSLTWRERRDHALRQLTDDGTISLAQTMPDVLAVQQRAASGFPAYLPSARALVGAAPPLVDEFGISGTENLWGYIFNDEYNPKLAGKNAIAIFDQMRRSDAQCHSTLEIIKLPLRSADPVIEAADNDPESQRHAQFCTDLLLADDAMVDSFASVLQHILLSEDFGTSAVEKVFIVGEQGEVRYHRLAPRLPKTFERFDVDVNGQLTQVVQYGPKQGRYDYWPIPADYIAVFPRDREGDNYWGMSTQRTAYKHWYYKNEIEHIDMIAHDKYGVGTPHAKLLTGFPIGRPGELQRLENALLGIRSGQRNFLITSDKVEIEILVASQGGGRPVKDSLDYHNIMITRNVLANHLSMGDQPHGTYNLGIAFMDMFLYALQARAEQIAADFKRSIIKPILDLNFNMQGRPYPKLKFQNLTHFDLAKLATAFAPLASAGIITITDDVEDMFRQLFDLPALSPTLRRDSQAGGFTRDAINAAAQAKIMARAQRFGSAGAATGGSTQSGAIAAADVVAAIKEEFAAQRQADPSLTTLPPLNIHLVMPDGRKLKTTTRAVERDARGLIVKLTDTEQELPHGN